MCWIKKIRKNRYSPANPFFCIKMGLKGAIGAIAQLAQGYIKLVSLYPCISNKDFPFVPYKGRYIWLSIIVLVFSHNGKFFIFHHAQLL